METCNRCKVLHSSNDLSIAASKILLAIDEHKMAYENIYGYGDDCVPKYRLTKLEALIVTKHLFPDALISIDHDDRLVIMGVKIEII